MKPAKKNSTVIDPIKEVEQIINDNIGPLIANPRVTPSISSTSGIKNNNFNMIHQGTATNALTKINTKNDKMTSIDGITNTATIEAMGVALTIPEFNKTKGFRTSTSQLLDIITIAFTHAGFKSKNVSLPLEYYMEKRGLKDKKEARKQVKEDLDILFHASISFKDKSSGPEADFLNIRIVERVGICKGVITADFGESFYNLLKGYPLMPYPDQLSTINSKYNPHSFYMLRKIAEHKNMNVGKKNEDIISVKTLLESVPTLPDYKKVKEEDRAFSRRIIEPFERDLDALEETLTWTYCHRNNTPLTDEELNSMSYQTFKDLLIKIDWKKYPDQTARLERKAKKTDKAKTKKKSAPKKKA